MQKKEKVMLGFNEVGMQQAGKTIIKSFAFFIGLFGLGIMLFNAWIGILIILSAIGFGYAISKSK